MSQIDTPTPSLKLSNQCETVVSFQTLPGIEKILLRDIADVCGVPGSVTSPGNVLATVPSLRRLLSIRTYTTFYVDAASAPGCAPSQELIASLLTAESLSRILRLCGDPAELRYRVAAPGDLSASEKKRVIDSTVNAIGVSELPFINDPSRYAVEIRLSTEGGTSFQWSPTAELDRRFSYRSAYVAAGIDPVVAAAIAAEAHRLQTIPWAKCIDPCCGSGTLLFERAQRSGVKSLVGIDISGNAIDAARKNLETFPPGVRKKFSFIRADATSFVLQDRFDLLVSNLPYGIRVGSHEDNVHLYTSLVERLPTLLAPGGVFCFYTQEIKLMNALLDRMSSQIRVVDTTRIAMGGLLPALIVGRMR